MGFWLAGIQMGILEAAVHRAIVRCRLSDVRDNSLGKWTRSSRNRHDNIVQVPTGRWWLDRNLMWAGGLWPSRCASGWRHFYLLDFQRSQFFDALDNPGSQPVRRISLSGVHGASIRLPLIQDRKLILAWKFRSVEIAKRTAGPVKIQA